MASKDESAPSEEPRNLKKCLELLRKAETDNDKLAALLLITKVVKAVDCTTEDRQSIVDSVGLPFLTRLLKTRDIPEGCPPSMFRSVALGVLSSLCDGLQEVPSSELKKQVPVFNEIILSEPSEDDDREMFRETQVDCYTVLTQLAATRTGGQVLMERGTPAAVVQVITRGGQDEYQAMSVLITLLRQQGPSVWTESLPAFNRLVMYLSHQISIRKDESLFHICDILTFILAMSPRDRCVSVKEKWVKLLVSSVTPLVKSKLGPGQRQCVLMLISSLVNFVGVPCLIPPQVSEPKLLLLVTHLAAIEIRIATENCTAEQLQLEMGKLVSYYSLLENIIHFLIADENLMIDPKQLAQLHSAMVGALNGVIFLLSQVACDALKLKLRHPVVVASLRILGAWMAEETEALKNEVMELVPFFIRLIKMEVGLLPFPDETDDNVEMDSPPLAIEGSDIKSVCATEEDRHDANATDTAASAKTRNSSSSTEESSTTTSLCVENSAQDSDTNSCSSQVPSSITGTSDSQGNPSQQSHKDSDSSTVDRNSDYGGARPKQTGAPRPRDSEAGGSGSDDSLDLARDFADLLKVNVDTGPGNEDLNYEMVSLDITRFLLPGLLHITAEDESRTSVAQLSGHEAFVKYYFRLHDRLMAEPDSVQLQSSMNTACNILLNFAMLDRELCSEDAVFHELLQKIAVILPDLVYKSHFVLYSCHLMALGLTLTRAQITNNRTSGENQRKLFAACITVLSRYVSMLGSEQEEVDEEVQDSWSEIHDLWAVCVQEVTALLGDFPDLVQAILKSGWVLVLCKLLSGPKGTAVDEEAKPLLLAFLCKLAEMDKTAQTIISKQGGLEIARLHGMKDLEAIMQDV